MLEIFIPYKYKKWSTLIGGFLIHLSLGSYYTFGNISPYLTSYLREYEGLDVRYSQATYILNSFGIFFSLSSIISGFINSKLNVNIRYNILIGCLIMNFGIGITFLTIKKSLALVLASYGVIYGIGAGCAYLGPLSMAMKWFPGKKGFSNSVILFGYGASASIFDQIQTLYINPKNYSPDKPYSKDFPNEKYFSRIHLDLLERVPKVFLIMTSICAMLQLIGFCLLSDPTRYRQNMSLNDDQSDLITDQVDIPEEKNSLGVNYQAPDDGLTLSQALKTKHCDDSCNHSASHHYLLESETLFTLSNGTILLP
ncbi:oxalate:formate antiporter-like isoform X1 [Brachionus plicatilis]|uniref:Oxalate:formate antiporter-like isoform X1 n=1 Tax=Brachionus plicatilis TaxID=10195 RepID=A0A3M7RNE5_BRAPC|nr:oxalate:formate antiporter-like isoform X1 [Brachionus plicatilis]